MIFSFPAKVWSSDIIIQQKRVEFDARYFLKFDGYYSTLPSLEKEQLDEQLIVLQEENSRLRAQNDLLRELLADAGTNLDDVPDVVDDGPYTPTLMDKKVYKIFKESCSSCHNESSQAAGLKLFDTEKQTMVLLPPDKRLLVYRVVNGVGLKEDGLKRMPPSGPLPNEDVNHFVKWLEESLKKQEQEDTNTEGE